MKRAILAVLLVLALLAMSGCGGGGDTTPVFVSDISSNPLLDGDIEETATGFIHSPLPPQSVFAGFDPVTGTETRAFLQFSLASIPLDAIISSATLDIVIDRFDSPFSTLPFFIDLVSFPDSTLIDGDFNRLTLASRTISFLRSDVGRRLFIDVTPLMQEAQRLGLPSFQIRILAASVSTGLIEINDTTGVNRGVLAPLLEVVYF